MATNLPFGPIDAVRALEETREFVHSYWGDGGGLEQVRQELTRTAQHNAQPLQESLAAINVVLNGNYPEGTLSQLVTWDANRVLKDRSDRGAAEWLRQVAELVRRVLDSVDPR